MPLPRAGHPDPIEELLGAYKPLTNVADEMLATDGSLRPVWRGFMDHFASLPAEQLAERVQVGEQYLNDAGVFFRQQESADQQERAWRFSPVPMLVHENDWQVLSDGLIQRADLLERVIADLYSENRLVADGLLPAPLVASNPNWLRPLVGVQPAGGYHLHFIAFEVGRTADGGWMVLADRTQAPAGAALALENRLATSRVFPEAFAATNVHRLAGFFRGFRDHLQTMAPGPQGRVAIFSGGPESPRYFEHTYLARYLGLSLYEGEDLTVANGEAMVRTVAGLRPVSVLWRSIRGRLCDPLELDETSYIGTPGLVRAVREGRLAMVNALGCGVVEARAMLAYLPQIAQAWLGEALRLPSIQTYWCGNQAAQAYVSQNLAEMAVSPAMSVALPFDPNDEATPGANLSERQRQELAARGHDWIGQNLIRLSSTPAYVEGRLQPRPVSLRVFAARTANGWQLMPGGYARVAEQENPHAISIREGGSAADVWVVSDSRVPEVSMAPPPSGDYVRPAAGSLPSRAADNLFWLGRYVERAEHMIRVLRAHHRRLAESGGADTALQASVAAYLEGLPADPDEPVPQALVQALNSAVLSAGRVRDRFSVDGWIALRQLAATAAAVAPRSSQGDSTVRAMTTLLRQIAGFTGLVHENMYRFSGWQFLAIGRALERAQSMTAILQVFADEEAPEGALDLAVEVGDAVITHRQRYAIATHRANVIDLMIYDTLNPRAVLFQLEEIRAQITRLPGAEDHGLMSPLARELLRIHAGLAVLTPETIDSEALETLSDDLGNVSNLLTAAYLS